MFFLALTAGMLAQQDWVEGRKLFLEVMSRYEKLAVEYSKKIAASKKTEDESDPKVDQAGLMTDVVKEFLNQRINIRAVLISELVEHDPLLTYEFYAKTEPDEKEAAIWGNRENGLLTKIIKAVSAERPERAVKVGREILKKKFNTGLIGLLEAIRKVDGKTADQFENEIVNTLDAESAKEDFEIELLADIFEYVEQLDESSEPFSVPGLSKRSLTKLGDIFAKKILAADDEAEYYYVESYIGYVEKYSPKNLKKVKEKLQPEEEEQSDCEREAAKRATDAVKLATVKINDAVKEDSDDKDSIETATDAVKKAAENPNESFSVNLVRFANGETPADLMEGFIETADNTIDSKDSSFENLNQIVMYVTGLTRIGKKEKGKALLDEVESLVTKEPKNFYEYGQKWALINGYAMVDPEKSFEILENAITRINETISAASKLVEFVDVRNAFLVDGELQSSYAYGFPLITGEGFSIDSLGATFQLLAESDFKRANLLNDKFEKQEVKVFARILLLRNLLSAEPEKTEKENP